MLFSILKIMAVLERGHATGFDSFGRKIKRDIEAVSSFNGSLHQLIPFAHILLACLQVQAIEVSFDLYFVANAGDAGTTYLIGWVLQLIVGGFTDLTKLDSSILRRLFVHLFVPVMCLIASMLLGTAVVLQAHVVR